MTMDEDEGTLFRRLGGAANVRALADRFYDLMDGDPAYAALRAMHAADLGPMRESLAGFLTAWLGGPRDWFAGRPGICIMSLHRAMAVTPETASQWLDAMRRALADTGADAETADLVWNAFLRMARGMIRDA